jgi:hypothetical protein
VYVPANDYFCAKIVVPPKSSSDPSSVLPPTIEYSKAPIFSRTLLQQRFGHISDNVLDKICQQQTISGLNPVPRVPPPQYTHDCTICSIGKLLQFRKVNTILTKSIRSGSLLHMYFAFWNVISPCGFTAVFTITYACTRMLWLFCTSSKKPSIHILRWFLAQLRREERSLANIRVDKDRALSGSTAFTTFIRDEAQLKLESAGGYISFLNSKVECPNHTLDDRA